MHKTQYVEFKVEHLTTNRYTHVPLYYRTRATISRSRLVAAPLRFQAKKHFLFAFYVVI